MGAMRAWAGDTGVRALKTAAQTLAGMLGAGAINLLHVDWKVDLAVSAGAAVACVLQNVQTMPAPWQAPAGVALAVDPAHVVLTPAAAVVLPDLDAP